MAVLSFSIQGSLQTYFARKYDALVVTLYRNLSLALTMLPLFFFVTWPQIVSVTGHLGTLVCASGFGAVALISALSSNRFLPIGISSAIRQMIQVICAVFLGTFFLQEQLTSVQVLILAGIALCGVSLALLRSEHAHLDSRLAWRGIVLTIAAGFFGAVSFYFFSILSRELHPFVSTYFWEVGVGVAALLYLVVLSAFGRHNGIIRLPFSDAYKIIVVALITIPASASYAFAVNHGPYALAGGIITMTTLVTTVFGWLVYKEHLTKLQGILICSAVGLMLLLKVLS